MATNDKSITDAYRKGTKRILIHFAKVRREARMKWMREYIKKPLSSENEKEVFDKQSVIEYYGDVGDKTGKRSNDRKTVNEVIFFEMACIL